jgi:hypothetical protein
MDLEVECRRLAFSPKAASVDSVSTRNAVLILAASRLTGTRRARSARDSSSMPPPATILELQFLIEAGRLRLLPVASVTPTDTTTTGG